MVDYLQLTKDTLNSEYKRRTLNLNYIIQCARNDIKIAEMFSTIMDVNYSPKRRELLHVLDILGYGMSIDRRLHVDDFANFLHDYYDNKINMRIDRGKVIKIDYKEIVMPSISDIMDAVSTIGVENEQ